eukprot:CAMPEP_0202508928 /NCGR_PEP_ID=MMETSP1361-20130828/52506_1 /ASSEMBLY_ACC=CAM_ASM_000849 /TAXON_ID=210615 /ORGANISM="Staurosira complex sp., Strain CCMP2646" /LENGTH=809 /DNA_ID=CAMNT_0049143123 /DNA_START=85 /DNA_END=2514 /DNA_ORIENTATION=-
MAMDVSSNAAPTLPAIKTDRKSKYVDDDLESEDVDDEEALLLAIEKEKEKEEAEEAAHPHAQPKTVTEAPRILQDALKQGLVAPSDSEEEEIKQELEKKVASPVKVATKDGSAIEEEKKGDDEQTQEPHYHARENQLDFLLSKASEYSNFIARDLEELQANMTEDARRKVEAAEKVSKKKGKRASKKQKREKSAAALKSAQDKDATIRAGGKKIVFVQPPNLSEGCILKDYQLEGVRWLSSLFENGVSGILADEMGLGKTIQVIALIGHLLTQNVAGPFIVVAPLATLPNWVREFEKWLPVRPVVRYHGAASHRESLMRGPLNPRNRKKDDYPFIVTSYEVAIKDQSKLERISEFTYLIVDEGQRLKNHRCTLLASLKRLKAANRLLLSGTPIQNNLQELWSLLNFVNPAIFDDLSVFQSWFGFKDIGQASHGGTKEDEILMEQRKNQTVSKLHSILRPFLLRRIKTDVLLDLPPKKEVVVYSGVSKLQAGYAELIEKGVLRDTLVSQGIEQGRTLSQTNKQMNHRKNINHPFLFGEPIDPNTGIPLGTAHPHLLIRASGKFALLDRMLERLFKDKHQVLIFSQMTSLLNVIEDYLILKRWNYCRIDGSTNIDDRQTQMDIFNKEKTSGENGMRNEADSRHFVFLLSTRAGGLGINLTSADTCIIFDSDWNPHQDSQAMDRCHRIGQTRPVAVYRLLTANSVDIEMMEKQISKKKLERMAIQGGDFRKAGISRGELSDKVLSSLLDDDIKNLELKGDGVENIKISDEEFDLIMDRKRLFAEGPDAIPTEGSMYDVITAASGDLLGSMNA